MPGIFIVPRRITSGSRQLARLQKQRDAMDAATQPRALDMGPPDSGQMEGRPAPDDMGMGAGNGNMVDLRHVIEAALGTIPSPDRVGAGRPMPDLPPNARETMGPQTMRPEYGPAQADPFMGEGFDPYAEAPSAGNDIYGQRPAIPQDRLDAGAGDMQGPLADLGAIATARRPSVPQQAPPMRPFYMGGQSDGRGNRTGDTSQDIGGTIREAASRGIPSPFREDRPGYQPYDEDTPGRSVNEDMPGNPDLGILDRLGIAAGTSDLEQSADMDFGSGGRERMFNRPRPEITPEMDEEDAFRKIERTGTPKEVFDAANKRTKGGGSGSGYDTEGRLAVERLKGENAMKVRGSIAETEAEKIASRERLAERLGTLNELRLYFNQQLAAGAASAATLDQHLKVLGQMEKNLTESLQVSYGPEADQLRQKLAGVSADIQAVMAKRAALQPPEPTITPGVTTGADAGKNAAKKKALEGVAGTAKKISAADYDKKLAEFVEKNPTANDEELAAQVSEWMIQNGIELEE